MPWPLSLLIRDPTHLGRVGPFGRLPFFIPNSDRHTHFYCIGKSGQGKSKFLESLLVADILAGRGCGLIDPHTDLARDTLAHLLSKGFFDDPATRDRVVYFEPTRTDYFIPFNILKSDLPPYRLAQQVIEAFRRTWPHALEEAPRFTNIALSGLLVLIETGQSLVEMPRLLTNRDYREKLLERVRDPYVLEFFRDRFDQWGRDTPLMIESVLNKVTAFTLNPYLRRCLGAKENRLNFRKIMDEGKVLLVDLGSCDEETRRLVGSLVVTGIENAALARKDPASRRPFYLFLDEFQDFCANEGSDKTLAKMLSECRKFGLCLHLAHQTLGQIRQRVSSALGNVGVKVVFALDREDAEVMARKLFTVDTGQVKHDAQTETQHPLYTPLSEQWEQVVEVIQALRRRNFFVKREGAAVAQVRTTPLSPYPVTEAEIEELMAQLARTHGIPVTDPPNRPQETPLPAAPVKLVDWEVVTPVL